MTGCCLLHTHDPITRCKPKNGWYEVGLNDKETNLPSAVLCVTIYI